MTNTEKLIEAVTYAEDNTLDWWDLFDSQIEAMKILKAAKKESPDEEQIVCLLSAVGSDVDIFESTAQIAYLDILQEMLKELKEAMD